MFYQSLRTSRVARTTTFALVIALACGLALTTPSASGLKPTSAVSLESLECHPGYGGQLYAAGGQVEVDIMKSDSDATNDIFFFRRGQAPLLIGNDKQTGRVIHLGSIPAGEELLF